MSTQRDPVCGMQVDSETASSSLNEGGQNFYFCSATCRQMFSESPARYLGSSRRGEVLERHEPPHTTTGNFTAPKFGSAGSGGLEFERLPESHDDRER